MNNQEKELLHIKAVYYAQADKDGHFENANKLVQFRHIDDQEWFLCSHGLELSFDSNILTCRLTHKTVIRNGREVPAPMSEYPQYNEKFCYYCTTMCCAHTTLWFASLRQKQLYNHGIFPYTEQGQKDCIVYGRACFNLSGIEEE